MGLFLRTIVSTATDRAYLSFHTPSCDMFPLLLNKNESIVLVMTSKNEASLSLVSNLVASRVWDERSDAR